MYKTPGRLILILLFFAAAYFLIFKVYSNADASKEINTPETQRKVLA